MVIFLMYRLRRESVILARVSLYALSRPMLRPSILTRLLKYFKHLPLYHRVSTGVDEKCNGTMCGPHHVARNSCNAKPRHVRRMKTHKAETHACPISGTTGTRNWMLLCEYIEAIRRAKCTRKCMPSFPIRLKRYVRYRAQDPNNTIRENTSQRLKRINIVFYRFST